MAKKNYVMSSGGQKYLLHLPDSYDGIKDACGLADAPEQLGDDVHDETEHSVLRKGKANRVSIGLENKKRRQVIVSNDKPIKGLINKTYGDSKIKSASIRQHVRLG